MWYTPAERNRFTGEPITRIIRVRKTITGEETVAIGVVIRLTRVAVMTIESNVTLAVITGTEAETGGIGMTISGKRLSGRPRTTKMTTERGATRIIITGMTGGIVIVTGTIGTDAGIVAIAMNGIGDTPGTTDPRIDIGTSVRAITRRGIARDRDRDRETVRHRYHLGR